MREQREQDLHRAATNPQGLRVLNGAQRLAMIDMDGTLLDGRFVLVLAAAKPPQGTLWRRVRHPIRNGGELLFGEGFHDALRSRPKPTSAPPASQRETSSACIRPRRFVDWSSRTSASRM